MKNKSIFVAVLILFSSCLAKEPESGKSDGKDFSKDEVVMEEVSRINGSKVSKEDVCIERPMKFKDLVMVGYFAHDRGCDGGLMFYKGKQITEKDSYAEILKDHGWDDKTKREVIALDWVKEVSLRWSIPMETEDEDFKSQEEHTFMPPTAKTENGEVIVAIWVREPSGMSPEANFYLMTVAFSIEEADIIRTQITDRFSVEFDQE